LQGRAGKLLLVDWLILLKAKPLQLMARQLREFALPAQLTGLSTVPVASWHGAIFAKYGAAGLGIALR